MAAASSAGPRRPVNILLVDDQPGKLLAYETILGELGENLLRASSGKEALERLLRTDIAVVLVDVCMPEIDGFELAAMIRNHPRYQRTAIILVSGVLVDDVDRMKGYSSGAVDYVSVPIVPEILRAKVAVFAELYRKNEELERLNRELERRVAERTQEIAAAAARLREADERLQLVLSSSRIRVWSLPIPAGADVGSPHAVLEEGEAAPGGAAEPTLASYLAAVHPGDRAQVASAMQRALSGDGRYAAEFRVVERGRERWIMGRGTVIRDEAGRAQSVSGIDMDITDRRRAEEERARLLAEAEAARREAERANRLKDEFLATLSHELRTPLHAITGWAHLIRSGSLSPEQQARGIETISRNAELQNQLISEILDVSRIVTGKLRLEVRPIDLLAVVQAALETVRPAAQAKRIAIEASLAPAEGVTGDAARLQQVMWNVLQNAIKFTPAGGRVDVTLADAGDDAAITVRDDGPGIAPDFLPYVFDRFRQADSSSTRPHQGLGLGLAIVRHLVEMHGGSVSAANREDRSGAVLRIVLPRRAAELADALPQAVGATPEEVSALESGSELSGLRVLVVDDEKDGRDLVEAVLRHRGALPILAGSAQEALALARESPPDVVLTDIEMPGEDGYSLLRSLRELPASHGGAAPAAALTAYAGPQDRARVLSAGFDAHVPKPIRPAELVAAVAALAARASSAGPIAVAASAAAAAAEPEAPETRGES